MAEEGQDQQKKATKPLTFASKYQFERESPRIWAMKSGYGAEVWRQSVLE